MKTKTNGMNLTNQKNVSDVEEWSFMKVKAVALNDDQK